MAQSVKPLQNIVESSTEKLRRRLRGDLDNIVFQALRKDAHLRYSTVEQLSADLLNHLTGQSVTARPATLRYRAEKYVKRNKVFVTLAATLLLALIIVAAVTLWQLRVARAREREQSRQLYAADMRQAGQDWADGSLIRLNDLLEKHRPGTSSDAWRGFEWYVLWKQLHKEKFTFVYQDFVPSACFTPDGKTILVGTRRIDMWDARSGQYLGVYATPQSEYSLTLSLTNDGKRLVTSGNDNSVHIWDFSSRRVIAALKSSTGARDWPNLSPDGRRLAVYWSRQEFKLYDLETGQFLQDLTLPPNDAVWPADAARYAPDGRLFVIQLDPQSDNQAALEFDYHACFTFSHDGRRLYLASNDHLLRAWDIQSGKLLQVFSGHQDMVEPPVLSHDDRILVSGSNDGTLRFWDAQTGKQLVLVKNESATHYLSFSLDQKYLAAVCQRGQRAKVWDVQKLLAEPPSAFPDLQMLALSPDGNTILTESNNEGVRLRDLQTGRVTVTYDSTSYQRYRMMNDAAFSPDGKLAVFGNQVCETRSGKLLATPPGFPPLPGERANYHATTFSPDGKLLASSDESGLLLKLWDTTIWRELATLGKNTSVIWGMAFSPDGSRVATGGSTIEVWDVAERRELLTLRGHPGSVRQVRFSPDGKMIASVSWDYTVRLWDAATGQELRSMRHSNSVQCVAFSPDGRRLASGGDDQVIRIWDSQTGAELTALHGHTSAPIWQIFFSQDGKTLVSSSLKDIRVWRAATDEEINARSKQ